MSKEQRQKPDEARGLVERKHSHSNEKEEEEDEEIKWFDNYERRIRAGAAESFKHKDLLNYFRSIRREYCSEISSEISSDDDYRSSSVRELDDVRAVRSVKGNRTRSARTKQGFRSRHRKARPKRKKIREIFECPSRNYDFYDHRCPSHEIIRYINGDHVESFTRDLIPNKCRPKPTYRVSRLSKRHSNRLIPPHFSGRYSKKVSKDWQSVNDINIIKSWSDQRVSRTKSDKERRSETQRSNRRNNSIYINPSLERSYLCHEETTTSRKEPEVHSCVLDKTNESSFQKRLSGGSNFSGSTNNQYCPRLDGPSSAEEMEEDEMEEEKKRKGVNKSRSPKCEKEASRKEEMKIRDKSDWTSKDPACVGSRYPHSRSFSNLSLARSTKGVTFEENVSEIPCKTPRQMSRSCRESEKTSLIEKRVHYQPKTLRINDSRKEEEEDLCYLCENERLNEEYDRRSQKLCKSVKSREGKKLLNCCCTDEEQEENAECNRCCCCPENLKTFQARPQYDTSRTYERFWKGKDILHSTSLPGTSFGANLSNREFAEGACDKNDRSKDQQLRDPSPDMLLSEQWKKCRECLKDFNEDYRKLSNDVKSIREIYCTTRDKASKKNERFYPSIEKDISFETRSSQRRTTDLRSPSRSNKIQETDCDCTEFLTEISPPSCQYGRYARSYSRRDVESRKKLENDSVRKLENFCDKVKGMNRRPFESKTKTNLKNRTLDENPTWCDCRYESETSVRELWKPSKRSSGKEWPIGNSVNLRIVKPKKISGKANLEKILIYPPEGAAGPPLTLFKNSSNISCQVKGDVDRGFRYNVTYVQKFVSPSWRPVGECPSNNMMRRNRNECDCSSDHG